MMAARILKDLLRSVDPQASAVVLACRIASEPRLRATRLPDLLCVQA